MILLTPSGLTLVTLIALIRWRMRSLPWVFLWWPPWSDSHDLAPRSICRACHIEDSLAVGVLVKLHHCTNGRRWLRGPIGALD